MLYHRSEVWILYHRTVLRHGSCNKKFMYMDIIFFLLYLRIEDSFRIYIYKKRVSHLKIRLKDVIYVTESAVRF